MLVVLLQIIVSREAQRVHKDSLKAAKQGSPHMAPVIMELLPLEHPHVRLEIIHQKVVLQGAQ